MPSARCRVKGGYEDDAFDACSCDRGRCVGSATCSRSSRRAPAGQPAAAPPRQPMSFFVTSVGKGDGANLGGLAGADAHCQALAKAAGQRRCACGAPT